MLPLFSTTRAKVGAAIRAGLSNASLNLTRAEIFIITKVEGGLSRVVTAARVAEDAAAIGLGRIDLVLLHYPKPAPGHTLNATIQDQWAGLAGAVRAGVAAAAGVSQFCTPALAALDAGPERYRPVLNQVGLHVGMGRDPAGVISTAAARGDMELMAYSPLAEADPALLNGPTERAIAAAHNVSTAQVALRWLSQRQIPFAVAAANPRYQAENRNVFGFELNASELSALTELSSPPGCPFWPGSACYQLECNKTHLELRDFVA